MKRIILLLGLVMLVGIGLAKMDVIGQLFKDQPNYFSRTIIDKAGPKDPWGKASGDINGDGKADLIVGGNNSQELVWYQNPAWTKHIVATNEPFSTDHAVVDIDNDGKNDIVSVTKNELLWFKNPQWTKVIIDNQTLHDVESADFDNDGKVDLVARNQSAFSGSGDHLYFYQQITPDKWQRFQLAIPNGEGLKVVDLNNDGKMDVVVNTIWYENPGSLAMEKWQAHTYATQWTWEHTYIDVGDIDGDKKLDIVLSPAEKAGDYYHLSWFSAPADPQSTWQEHIVSDHVDSVHHFVGLSDVNKDGQLDILTAAMHQGEDPDEVSVFVNQGKGKTWQQQIISTTGSHSMKIVDIDNDGDEDLFGANWSGPKQQIELWENKICPPDVAWQRHVIDDDRPWGAIFVTAKDIDNDNYADIITGAWWYKNPGFNKNRRWKRQAIVDPANNMALVFDIDKDGDHDILATQGKGSDTNGKFVLAINDGKGKFSPQEITPTSQGDFLQGVANISMPHSATTRIALSWHHKDNGVQLLETTVHKKAQWQLNTISPFSQDEALSAGDIDNDGDIDLLLGTRWLRNTESNWSLETINPTNRNPDRNLLVDLNKDGKLDAVVGFEAISVPGDVVWYEQGKDSNSWIEHLVATVVGPMSLDVADMDKDGDLDIVVGEHNLKQHESARLLVFNNVDGHATQWEQTVVWQGDEHHDGAQVVDIDNDGDNDIISIGWGHKNVILYENKAGNCK